MKILMTLVLLLVCTEGYAKAKSCDELPSAGVVSKTIRIVDDTTAIFQANLEINSGPAYGNPNKIVTAHTYRQPQIIYNGRSIVMTQRASSAIAKMLGYERQELGVLKENSSIFGEKVILDVDGGSFVFRKASGSDIYQDREGYVIFYHSTCADWIF